VYLVVGFLVFGEAGLFVGFVLPGETAVLIGGAIAGGPHHRVSIIALCIIVVACAIFGDSVGYLVGERYGHHLMNLPILRHRRVTLERALDGLRRRGPIYVFIGRFTAFLRAVMPGLAGMSKMHYRRFLIANAIGGIAWGLTFTLLGYYLGQAVDKYAGPGGIIILIVLALVVTGNHIRSKRTERREDATFLARQTGSADVDEPVAESIINDERTIDQPE
jgi:membrane protein DedA with SNARE-associated domain